MRICRWELVTVSHHIVMLNVYWSGASGGIKYLKCHANLQNHVIERSSNFMSGSSSSYITTLPSLLVIAIAL